MERPNRGRGRERERERVKLPSMRRQGPLTTRHIIVAVLVMVVINAQLTWWIVFILRLNRSNLGFERERLLDNGQLQS